MATFQGIIIANIYGKLDNSYIFVASFSFLSTDLMQTFSNELIPLRKNSKVIIFERNSHPPPLVLLLAIIHVCVCSCLLRSSKYLCHGNKLK